MIDVKIYVLINSILIIVIKFDIEYTDFLFVISIKYYFKYLHFLYLVYSLNTHTKTRQPYIKH